MANCGTGATCEDLECIDAEGYCYYNENTSKKRFTGQGKYDESSSFCNDMGAGFLSVYEYASQDCTFP